MKLTWQGRYIMRNGHTVVISRSVWDKDTAQVLWLGRCDGLDQTITFLQSGQHRYGTSDYDIVREWTGNVIPADFSVAKRAWDIDQHRFRRIQKEREEAIAERREKNRKIINIYCKE